MFKSRNKLFVILWATLVFFLTPTIGFAAENNAASPFVVKDIGVMSIDGRWKAVSIEYVLTAVEKMIAKNSPASRGIQPKKQEFGYSWGKELAIKMLDKANIKIYQLAMDRNNTYYTSYLVFYKLNEPIPSNFTKYFSKDSKKRDKRMFVAKTKEIQNKFVDEINSVTQDDIDFNVEALPNAKPEMLTINGLPAYGIESRIAVNIAGLTSPFYAKTYVFNADGNLAAAVLFSVDGEKPFWNKTFKSMIKSLKVIPDKEILNKKVPNEEIPTQEIPKGNNL